MDQEPAEIASRIWDESRSCLRNFIAKRVNNDADADDILQDVFFKIYQNLDSLKDPAKIYPWVFQTTRNAIADHFRNRRAVLTAIDDDSEVFAFNPEDTFVEEEVLSWLEPMIGELPAKYRDAVMLADIEGLTQKNCPRSSTSLYPEQNREFSGGGKS